jgi:hypothetical protein
MDYVISFVALSICLAGVAIFFAGRAMRAADEVTRCAREACAQAKIATDTAGKVTKVR